MFLEEFVTFISVYFLLKLFFSKEILLKLIFKLFQGINSIFYKENARYQEWFYQEDSGMTWQNIHP